MDIWILIKKSCQSSLVLKLYFNCIRYNVGLHFYPISLYAGTGTWIVTTTAPATTFLSTTTTAYNPPKKADNFVETNVRTIFPESWIYMDFNDTGYINNKI